MPRLPLHRYKFFQSADPDYVCEMVGKVLGPQRLDVAGGSTSLDARLHTRRLSDISISFLAYGTEVIIQSNSPSTHFAIHLPLTGASASRCEGDLYTCTPKLALVVSPGDTVATYWDCGCRTLIVRIERVAVEAELATLLGSCVRRPLRFARTMDTTQGSGAVVSSALRTFAAQLDRDRGLFDNKTFVRAFERMLMLELLFGQPHNYSAQLHVGPVSATSKEVEHAVALLESHPEQPHTVTRLAEQVAVSTRSLQRGFHVQLGTTFQEVLRDIRLRRVHDELRAAHPDDVTVTEVLSRWRLSVKGYTYAAYRRRYGETPMCTLKRGA